MDADRGRDSGSAYPCAVPRGTRLRYMDAACSLGSLGQRPPADAGHDPGLLHGQHRFHRGSFRFVAVAKSITSQRPGQRGRTLSVLRIVDCSFKLRLSGRGLSTCGR